MNYTSNIKLRHISTFVFIVVNDNFNLFTRKKSGKIINEADFLSYRILQRLSVNFTFMIFRFYMKNRLKNIKSSSR